MLTATLNLVYVSEYRHFWNTERSEYQTTLLSTNISFKMTMGIRCSNGISLTCRSFNDNNIILVFHSLTGMFMFVGHIMLMMKHRDETEIDWEYGYSFKLAWTSFVLCLITGIIDFIVYRNFRKITEEMMLGTVPSPSAKYVTRTSPVNLQSSI